MKQSGYLVEVDEHLVQQLRDGKEPAYELVFHHYFRALTLFAKKYLSDLDLSQQLVQDVLVGIYLNRHKLEIQTSLSGYLYRAVKNKCLDYLESQEIHKKHHEIILQSSPDHYRMDDSLNAAEFGD